MFQFFKKAKKTNSGPLPIRVWNGNEICPHLGLAGTPETYCNYASTRNRCHAPGKHPAEVAPLKQTQLCLSGEYRRCELCGAIAASQPSASKVTASSRTSGRA